MTRRRLIVAGLASLVALGVAATIVFFPYEVILRSHLDSRLRRAEIEATWGAIRYSFPRSIVLVGSSFRSRWGGRPVEVKVDRATITPHFSCLWGTEGAHVEVQMGGGTISLDAERTLFGRFGSWFMESRSPVFRRDSSSHGMFVGLRRGEGHSAGPVRSSTPRAASNGSPPRQSFATFNGSERPGR